MKTIRTLLLAMVAATAISHTALATGATKGVEATALESQLVFTGENDNGSLQLALEDAIGLAHTYFAQMGYSDYLIDYRVRDVSGLAGGFAGFNIVRVTIVLPNPPAGVWNGQP